MSVDTATLLLPGPWEHRFVAANGARFHVAVAGPDDRTAPLVVLLHGVPEMWWAWRYQLPVLAGAGYRVAAMDLRGTGASDKPPQGYDVPTLARDVGGVIGSLGAGHAVVVGHGLGGGQVAWAMPAYHPGTVRAVAALAAPHPLHLHTTRLHGLAPGAWRHLLAAQVPGVAERSMADRVGTLLAEWGGDGWPPADVVATYRRAAQVPFAAHSQLEVLRWLVRSSHRPDGQRFAARLRTPVNVPVLQVHGSRDGLRGPGAAVPGDRAAARLAGAYRYELVHGAGHFLPEEAAGRVDDLLLDWLGEVAPLPR